MVKFTNDQRLEIIKNYYRNSESIAATLRALTPIFGRNNRPTRQAVRAIVDKFETKYSLLDIPVPVRQRTGRSDEHIAAVKASIENEPNQSIPRRSQELGISQTTLWRILHKDLTKTTGVQPKRPPSAYMLWLNSARDEIKRENPGLNVSEVARRGREIWKGIKDKSEWEAKAAKAKEDYERALREFETNPGSTTTNGNTKKRGKNIKTSPKKIKISASDEDVDDNESDNSQKNSETAS